MNSSSFSIAMISDDYAPAKTGAGVHVRALSEELVKRGHRVVVITSRRKGQPEVEMVEGVKLYRTSSVTISGYRLSVASKVTLRKLLLREAIQLIHLHYLGLLLWRSYGVAKELGLPILYTHLADVEILLSDTPGLGFLAPFIQRKFLQLSRGCNLIIVPSSGLIPALRLAGVESPIRYVSCICNFERLRATQPKETSGVFRVLFVGRLSAQKNIRFLLRSFSRFHRSYPDAQLWIAGSGCLETQLKRECRRLGIAPSVRFAGHVGRDELGDFLVQGDVFVFPSLSETQGLVVVEAMHFGLPVLINQELPSALDLVEHGKSGFLMDVVSDEDLVSRLVQLRNDPSLRLAMGQRSKERTSRFRTGDIVDSHEELYGEQMKFHQGGQRENRESHPEFASGALW